MDIRKKLEERITKWISESPAVEKSIETFVEKTKESVAEEINKPLSDETKLLFGAGAGIVGIILMAIAMKQPSKSAEMLEPIFRTVTINNYYS